MIPLLDLKAQFNSIKDEIKDAINEVLESQQFILGIQVQQLEEAVCRYAGSSFAIGVASGSDALLLAMMAIGVGPGDEVITTPYTFFATAGSISRLGAKPVFVDIDPRTYNINPSFIEKKITKHTKAIIPVHLFGQSANMDPILKIAKEHKLFVIEDAAQSLGAKYKWKNAGTMGDFGTLSFFPTKNLGGIGDGGMVLTNHASFAEKIRKLRVHGAQPKYYHEMIGLSSRLDTIQAAVLLVKLKYLDSWTAQRQTNAKVYNELFAHLDVVIPFVEKHNEHIFNQYVIRVRNRDGLKKFLTEQKIYTEIYYPLPLHLQKCYAHLKYRPGDFPESESAARETLGLPIYPELNRNQQEEVVKVIRQFIKKSAKN